MPTHVKAKFLNQYYQNKAFILIAICLLCFISQLLINFKGERRYHFRCSTEEINNKKIWLRKSSGFKYLVKYFEVPEYIRV